MQQNYKEYLLNLYLNTNNVSDEELNEINKNNFQEILKVDQLGKVIEEHESLSFDLLLNQTSFKREDAELIRDELKDLVDYLTNGIFNFGYYFYFQGGYYRSLDFVITVRSHFIDLLKKKTSDKTKELKYNIFEHFVFLQPEDLIHLIGQNGKNVNRFTSDQNFNLNIKNIVIEQNQALLCFCENYITLTTNDLQTFKVRKIGINFSNNLDLFKPGFFQKSQHVIIDNFTGIPTTLLDASSFVRSKFIKKVISNKKLSDKLKANFKILNADINSRVTQAHFFDRFNSFQTFELVDYFKFLFTTVNTSVEPIEKGDTVILKYYDKACSTAKVGNEFIVNKVYQLTGKRIVEVQDINKNIYCLSYNNLKLKIKSEKTNNKNSESSSFTLSFEGRNEERNQEIPGVRGARFALDRENGINHFNAGAPEPQQAEVEEANENGFLWEPEEDGFQQFQEQQARRQEEIRRQVDIIRGNNF